MRRPQAVRRYPLHDAQACPYCRLLNWLTTPCMPTWLAWALVAVAVLAAAGAVTFVAVWIRGLEGRGG